MDAGADAGAGADADADTDAGADADADADAGADAGAGTGADAGFGAGLGAGGRRSLPAHTAFVNFRLPKDTVENMNTIGMGRKGEGGAWRAHERERLRLSARCQVAAAHAAGVFKTTKN